MRARWDPWGTRRPPVGSLPAETGLVFGVGVLQVRVVGFLGVLELVLGLAGAHVEELLVALGELGVVGDDEGVERAGEAVGRLDAVVARPYRLPGREVSGIQGGIWYPPN